MNKLSFIYILIFGIAILLIMNIFLLISRQKKSQILKQISKKLSEILEQDTNEKVMIFTNDAIIIELLYEINLMLEDRQKVKVDYRKSEISSKRMISNISHDIKTPLTVILGYLEMLIMNKDENTTMLKIVENKANQVMGIINNFFTLAKIEAGDSDISLSRVNINEICKKDIIDFYMILTEKNFDVEIKIPEKNIYVSGNEEALNRILFNLISNAVRYGYEGKYLGIFLRETINSVFIDIIDKGKGIEKSMLENVFARLYMADDSRSGQLEGNGLGLAIAKSLAQKMNGDITLISEPHMKTIFTLELKKINY